MPDETSAQQDNNPTPSSRLPNMSGGQRVIQPTPELLQELHTQPQQKQPLEQSAQSTVNANGNALLTEPVPAYTPPNTPVSDGQIQIGASASQMGWSQLANKNNLNLKSLVMKGVGAFVVIGAIFAVLVYTNIIALSKFKTINYTDSNGMHYKLTFYAKHTTKTLKSGNTSLVSKVSVGDKYPLTLIHSKWQ